MKGAALRLAIGLEYDGTRYAGWQRQPGLATIEDCVQRALAAVAGHAVAVVAAGRTDAGVHATGQVCHFDAEAARPLRGWVLGANSHLPADIAVTWAAEVGGDFHARHSARARAYRYCFLESPTRPALARERACWVRARLEVAAMHEAAQALAGEHDFSAFRAAECESPTPMRRIERIAVTRAGPLVLLDVEANAFLHHMVRNIAGTLMAVGTGERDVASVAATLGARDRTAAGVTAPAAGLYLRRVRYPEAARLPELVDEPPWAMIAAIPGHPSDPA